MRQCEKCGQEIVEGAAFCANCGASVDTAQSAPEVGVAQPADTVAPVVPEVASEQPMEVSTAAPAEEPKKKMDGKMIAMIAVSAVCLIVGIVGIVLAVTNNGSSNNGGQVATNDSNNGGGTVDVVSSGTKVSYAGYEFVIPEGYDYEITDLDGDDALATSNSDDYAAFTMFDNSVTFTQIENNSDYLAEDLGSDAGVEVTTSTETVDGVKFLCFDFGTVGDVDMMYAVSEVDLYYFQTTIFTNPGVSGKQYLSNVAEIVKSAEKKTGDRAFNDTGYSGIKMPKLTIKSQEE